jgi:hypothetical protein
MSNFEFREMTVIDRETARRWLSILVGNPFPTDFFPATGAACCIDGHLACVIPVYIELTTNVAVLGHCMINPDLPATVKHQAADGNIRYAIEYVRKLGKRHILTMFGNRAVNRIADRIGLVTADRDIEQKYCLLV